MNALRIVGMVALLPLLLVIAACVVIYVGDPRTLQPQCLVLCDATAAAVNAEGSASGVISQQGDQGPLSNRGRSK
jgi:hypothetical protein